MFRLFAFIILLSSLSFAFIYPSVSEYCIEKGELKKGDRYSLVFRVDHFRCDDKNCIVQADDITACGLSATYGCGWYQLIVPKNQMEYGGVKRGTYKRASCSYRGDIGQDGFYDCTFKMFPFREPKNSGELYRNKAECE